MSIRVSAVQFKRSAVTDPHRSMRAWAEELAPSSDLLVFPEMAASGYIFPNRAAVMAVAEDARGDTFAALSPVAKANKTWVVAGYPERAGERLYNSACVINPSGELAFTYRKTLLYSMDELWAEPGDSGYRYFDADWGRFTVGICMDLNDDAFISWLQHSCADVLAFPTNWLQEDMDVWAYWAWRMGELKTTLVAANTYGVEGDIRFSGRSVVLRERTIYAAADVSGNHAVRAVVPSTANALHP